MTINKKHEAMKKAVYLLIFVVVIISGCSRDSLTEDNVYLKKRSDLGVIVPAKCWFTTAPDYSLGFILCLPPEMEVSLLGGGWMAGHLTHGGTLISDQSYYRVLNCNFDYLTLTVSESIEGVHTVANGDYYWFTSDLQVNVTNGMLTGTVIVNGGTGRYEGATAMLVINGIHDLQTNVATMTGEGSWTFMK